MMDKPTWTSNERRRRKRTSRMNRGKLEGEGRTGRSGVIRRVRRKRIE